MSLPPRPTPASLASLLIAFICAMAGCERRPTAVAIFEMTASPEVLTLEGEPELEKSLNAAIRKLAEYDLESRDSIKAVISDLNLTKGFPRSIDGALTTEGSARYNKLVDSLIETITVKNETRDDGMRLVRVGTTLEDGELAERFVNQLVENHIRAAKATLDKILLKELMPVRVELSRLRGQVSELTQSIAASKPLSAPSNPSTDTETEEDRLRARVRELEERWEKVKEDVQVKRTELHEAEKKLAIVDARMRKLQMHLTTSQGYDYLKLKFVERADSKNRPVR